MNHFNFVLAPLVASLPAFMSLTFSPSFATAASERPQCTATGITEDCEAFKEFGRTPVLRLPDGSAFPNPLVPMGPHGHNHDPEATGELAEGTADEIEPSPLVATDLKLQMRMSNVWNSLPPNMKVSPKFRSDFSQLVPLPDKLTAWAGKKMLYPPGVKPESNDRVSIFWPPQNPSAQRKVVNVDEIVRFLNTLPDESKKTMRAIVVERAEVKVEMVNASFDQVQPVAKTDLEGTFRETRQLFLDEITKGRDPNSLSPDETAAYAKVASIRLAPADPKSPFCVGLQPNAYYAPVLHSFSICPGLMGWPKSAITRIIAHEMAHAIDPCVQTFPLLKINREAFRKLPRSSDQWPPSIRSNLDIAGALVTAQEALRQGAVYTNAQNILMMRDPKAIDQLIKLGYFELAAIAVPDGEGIGQETYTCLRDKAKFKELSEKDLKDIGKQLAESYQDQIGAKVNQSKFSSDMKERMKNHSQCFKVPGKVSHMCEAMADAWSAKVLGRYLEKSPPKSKIEKLATFAWDFRTTCFGKNSAAKGEASEVPLVAVTKILMEDSAGHPSNRMRSDRIVLTEPRIQKAMGCEPVAQTDCVSKLGVQGPVAPVEKRVSPNKKSGTQTQGVK